MSDERDSTAPASTAQWAVRLGLAALTIGVVTGATFYYTTRDVFARSRESTLTAPPVDPTANVISLEHGLAVYARNCAACHGPTGLGDGAAGAALNPKPRDFSTGWFKLGGTRTGLPSEDDLIATIRHGMLPAMMPPWPQLSDGEVKSVAMAVSHLAVEARVNQRLARDATYPRDRALREVHAQLDAGPRIVLPPRPATLDLRRGEQFYLTNCAACHDPDGRGRLRDDLVDNEENPIAARDFTSGQFKGGGRIQDIALRIVRGMPGTPMPANPTIAADDLWSTAAYVRRFHESRQAPTVETKSEGIALEGDATTARPNHP